MSPSAGSGRRPRPCSAASQCPRSNKHLAPPALVAPLLLDPGLDPPAGLLLHQDVGHGSASDSRASRVRQDGHVRGFDSGMTHGTDRNMPTGSVAGESTAEKYSSRCDLERAVAAVADRLTSAKTFNDLPAAVRNERSVSCHRRGLGAGPPLRTWFFPTDASPVPPSWSAARHPVRLRPAPPG